MQVLPFVLIACGLWLALLCGVAALCRPILLWYWRVDEMVSLLKSIDVSLKLLPAVREHRGRPQTPLRKVSQ